MGKKGTDDTLGCMFMMIFFPFVFGFALIKDLINGIVVFFRYLQKKDMEHKEKRKMDDMEFDEMNDTLDEIK